MHVPHGGHRILARLGLGDSRQIQPVQAALDLLQEVDGQVRGGHGVLPERELVQLPDPFPAVLAQRVEELEQFDRVHSAGDHVVVPAAQVVVDVHPEQPPIVDRQLGGIGRGLPAEQGVAEVEQDAHVRQPDLLDAEQGAGHRVEAHVHPWFARLVLDHKLQVRVLARQLADSVQRGLPERAVVHLERVVPAVLTGPELDVLGTEVAHHPGRLGAQLVGEPAHARVRIGE